MLVRDYERLSLCTALTDPCPPAFLDLLGLGVPEVCPDEPLPGLSRAVPREYAGVLAAATEALDRLQVPYHLVDSELSAERMAAYRLLVVPGLSFLDAGLVARLSEWAAAGGALVLCPETPTLDATFRPLSPPMPPHDVFAPEDLRPALEAHVERLGLGPQVRAPGAEVDLALYHGPSDQRPRVLFVANRTGDPQQGAISGLPAGQRAWDALGAAPFDLNGFRLAPFEVRMLRLGSDLEDR